MLGLAALGVGIVGMVLMIAAMGLDRLNSYNQNPYHVYYGWHSVHGDLKGDYDRDLPEGLKASNAGRCWLAFGIVGIISFALGCTLIGLAIMQKKKKSAFHAFISLLDAGILCLIAAIVWLGLGSKAVSQESDYVKVGASTVLGELSISYSFIGIIAGILGLGAAVASIAAKKQLDDY